MRLKTLAVLGVAAAAVYRGGHAAAAPAAASSGYVNPLGGGRWTPDHTDQGVDYHPDVPEPVRAIGDGTIVYSSTADMGWPGGAFISYRLASGPKARHVVYVAEHLTSLLPVGAHVRAGQRIATAWPGYPWTEWGWTCRGDLPAVRYNGAPDGTATAGGLAFARFMRELGAATAQDPGPGPDVAGGC